VEFLHSRLGKFFAHRDQQEFGIHGSSLRGSRWLLAVGCWLLA
jgi:hypothetical protein